jgi:Lipase (class 3)
MKTDSTGTILNRRLDLLVKKARQRLSSADWTKFEFDQRKALALALCSEIAYYKIGEHEYRRTDRAKIIPCMAYQSAIESRVRLQFETALRGADFDEFFVVESRNFVAVGLVLREIVVVAVRGTYYLYDWTINFNARKELQFFEDIKLSFHSGFLREAELLRYHLRSKLSGPALEKKIIITGHSLGAAVAAILNARLSHRWWRYGYEQRYVNGDDRVGACYVFAAPRYSNFSSLLQIENPFNCINDYDVVPRVPPRMLGYANSFAEFDLQGSPYLELEDPRQSMLVEWLRVVATGRFLKNHSMETYRRKIGNSLMRHQRKP